MKRTLYMKRTLFLMIWLVMPVAIAVFHYGPGNDLMARDQAADHLEAAEKLNAAENFAAAEREYSAAMATLPPEEDMKRSQLELAKAYSRMRKGELVEAMTEMESLLSKVAPEPEYDEIERETRSTLARAQYYAGWIMRLEGADTADWKEQTEAARQNFRLLAETELQSGEKARAEAYQENLEAAIRLERMDLKVLQGLPLPQEGQGAGESGDVSDKMAKKKGDGDGDGDGDGKGKGQGQGQGMGESGQDARGKGAGDGERPPGLGS
ncbi:MAG: hypothetical protein ACOCVL_01625 [Candidatus Sumerlaeota bacterium]